MSLLSGPSSNLGQKTGHWGSGDCKQPEVVAIFSPCSWQRHRASCLQVIHAYIVSGHKLSLVSQSNSCMLSCDFNGQNGLFSCRLRSSEPSVQSSQGQKCLEVVVLEECYLRCRYMFVSAQWSCRSCAKKRNIGEQQLKNDTTAMCSNQGLLLDSWCLLYLIVLSKISALDVHFTVLICSPHWELIGSKVSGSWIHHDLLWRQTSWNHLSKDAQNIGCITFHPRQRMLIL